VVCGVGEGVGELVGHLRVRERRELSLEGGERMGWVND